MTNVMLAQAVHTSNASPLFPRAYRDARRQFTYDKLREGATRCRQVTVRIDQPEAEFAAARARQHALQPAGGDVLHADRKRQERDAEAIGGAIGGEPRLVDRHAAVDDHVVLPLADVDAPRNPVGARTQDHAAVVLQLAHGARIAVQLEVDGAGEKVLRRVYKPPSDESGRPGLGT